MIEELKPCPFCGGEVKKVNRLGIPMFKCQKLKCGAVISFDNYFANRREAEAIKNWNTRAKEPTITTNEERREIAARLREIAPGSDWPDMVAEACGLDPQEMSNNFHEFTGELCEYLANLIEPEPERTCFKVIPNEMEGYVFCSKCGAEIGEYGVPNYCHNCGAKVVSNDD